MIKILIGVFVLIVVHSGETGAQVSQVPLYDNTEARVIWPFPNQGDYFLAQQFLTGDFQNLSSFTFQLRGFGSPSGPLHFELWNEDGAGLPGERLSSLGTVDLSSLSRRTESFEYAGPDIQLSPNSAYFVVMNLSEASFGPFENDTFKIPVTLGNNEGARGAKETMVTPPFQDTGWITLSEAIPGNQPPMWLQMLVTASPQLGDFDGSGELDVADIDLLGSLIRAGATDPILDLAGGPAVDDEDYRFWVKELNNTYFGDADLDGDFDSSDLVAVFQAGEYEDEARLNSGWATGDWNGDGDFDSGDLVLAFQDGGFEQQPPQAVSAVPEPASLVLFVLGVTMAGGRWRRSCR